MLLLLVSSSVLWKRFVVGFSGKCGSTSVDDGDVKPDKKCRTSAVWRTYETSSVRSQLMTISRLTNTLYINNAGVLYTFIISPLNGSRKLKRNVATRTCVTKSNRPWTTLTKLGHTWRDILDQILVIMLSVASHLPCLPMGPVCLFCVFLCFTVFSLV